MKVLIIAHPDDEALWFSPEDYDRIIIVFEGRMDKPWMGPARRAALAAHPLREKITCLRLTESGLLRAKSKDAVSLHAVNYATLCDWLNTQTSADDSVTTHNAMGEYQHPDHLLVYRACMATLCCPVNGKDPALYRAIKKAYTDNGCWTWHE